MILNLDNSKIIKPRLVPDQVKYDFSFVIANEFSTNVTLSESVDSYFINFDLLFNESCTPIDNRIEYPEPITFEYKKDKNQSKPPCIWAVRDGFPSNLPHLNPTKVDEPASICLWRNGGNDELYQQQGINGFLGVLPLWMEDAQDGNLQRDGWEPTPRGGFIEAVCKLSAIQKYTSKVMRESSIALYGTSDLCLYLDEKSTPIMGEINIHNVLNPKRPDQKLTRFIVKESVSKWESSKSHVMVLVAPSNLIQDSHFPLEINSLTDFEEYCKYAGVYNKVDLVKILMEKMSQQYKGKGCIKLPILIAQKRPKRLIEDIPDLAEDESGKIEVLLLLATFDNKTKNYNFIQCSLTGRGSADLYSSMSNSIDISKCKTSIIGCGSLGSSIADMMCKDGMRELSLVDPELLSPHNVARHVLGKGHVGKPKSLALASYFKEKYHSNVEPIWGNIQDNFEKNRIKKSNLLVDATANPIVAEWIDQNYSGEVVKCFISMSGRIGVFMSKTQELSFSDLETILYFQATISEQIKNWLKNENLVDSKVLGMGCGSVTSIMPYSTVLSHSSYFQTVIRNKLVNNVRESLKVNILSKDMLPIKSIDIQIPKFERYQINTNDRLWTTMLSEYAGTVINEATKSGTPNESCGYLIGRFSFKLKRITIITATYCSNAISTSVSAVLPSVENDKESLALIDNSVGLLQVVGTWHSHPTGSAKPSNIDMNTMKSLIKPLNDNPQPYLMLINSITNEKTISLIEPELWK